LKVASNMRNAIEKVFAASVAPPLSFPKPTADATAKTSKRNVR
jgi:hypothetical protein